jgi:hypothetical protein
LEDVRPQRATLLADKHRRVLIRRHEHVQVLGQNRKYMSRYGDGAPASLGLGWTVEDSPVREVLS